MASISPTHIFRAVSYWENRRKIYIGRTNASKHCSAMVKRKYSTNM